MVDISKTFKGSKKTQLAKLSFLDALTANVGIVSKAVKDSDTGSNTHYTWLKNDEAYKQAVEDIKNEKGDVVESALFKLIEKGNSQAIIFAAKTLLRSRGYGESLDITSGDEPITLNINI